MTDASVAATPPDSPAQPVTSQNDAKSLVNSVLRACHIMELFAQEGSELTLSRIAEASSLSRPTAHRLLNTLVAAGWVRKTAAGRYALTLRMFTVASSASVDVSIREIAEPTAAELAQVTGDSAYFHVPNDGASVCIIRVDGPHPVRVHHVSVGDTIPMLSGAAPVAMSAFDSRLVTRAAEVRAAQRAPWKERLDLARQLGYVVSPDDLIVGVTAVGAPVFGADGAVVGGIAVTGVNSRYDEAHIALAVEKVTEAAATISRQLGFRSPDASGH
jgi:DNA-binding IclR family transcriptional regulator